MPFFYGGVFGGSPRSRRKRERTKERSGSGTDEDEEISGDGNKLEGQVEIDGDETSGSLCIAWEGDCAQQDEEEEKQATEAQKKQRNFAQTRRKKGLFGGVPNGENISLLSTQDDSSMYSSGLAQDVAKRLAAAEERALQAEELVRKYALEIKTLKQQIAKDKQERIHLEERFKQELNSHCNELKKAENELRKREMSLSKVESELGLANEMLEKARKDREVRESRHREEKIKLNETLRVNEEMIAELTSQLRKTEQDVERESKQGKMRLSEICENYHAENRKRDELEVELQRLKQREADHHQALDSAAQQVAELEELLRAAETAEHEAKRESREIQRKLHRAEREKAGMDKAIQDLEARIHECQDALKLSFGKREEKQEKLRCLQQSLLEVESQLAKQESSKSRILSQVNELGEQADDAAKFSKGVSRQIFHHETELERNRQDIKDLEHTIATLTRTFTSLQQQVRQAEGAVVGAEEDVQLCKSQAKSALEQARQSERSLEQAMANLNTNFDFDKELERLRKERDRLRRENDLAVETIAGLEREIDQREQTANSLKRKVKTVQQELYQTKTDSLSVLLQHKRALKAKEKESNYVWNKLEEALHIDQSSV